MSEGPALRVDGAAGLAGSLLRHRLRPGEERRGRGLRRLGQDLDAGVAHRCGAARRRRAARDPRHHLHPRRGRRDARPPRRLARRMVDAAPTRTRRASRELRMRGIGPDDAVRLEPALRALHGRLLDSGRPVADPHLPRLVRAAAAARAAGDAGVARPAARHVADRGRRSTCARRCSAPSMPPCCATPRCAPTTRPWSRRAAGAARPVAGPRLAAADRDRRWPTRPARSRTASSRLRSGVAGARGRRRPGAAGRRRRMARAAARARRGLAAAQNKTPARRRARRSPRPTPADAARAASTRSMRRCSPKKARVAQAAPSRRRWPRRGEFLARLRRAGRPARRPRSSISAWSGSRARCSPRIADHKRAHGLPTWPISNGCALAAAARRRPRRLGAGEARPARAPPADRRVPGHQPAAMARAACLARVVRRRRRRRERAAAAEPLHRRRPEAEPLPLSRRRAARVRGGAPISCVEALGGHRLACDHTLAQRAAGDRGDQPGLRGGRGRGRVRGLPRAQHGAGRSGPATASGGCLASLAPEKNREGERPDSTQTWRDTLLTAARSCPTRCCASRRRRGAADLLRRWLAAGDATPAETMLLARKRESLHLAADALRRAPCRTGRSRGPTLMDAAERAGSGRAPRPAGLAAARPLARARAEEPAHAAPATPTSSPWRWPTASRRGWWAALQALAEPSPALARARTLLRGWAEAAARAAAARPARPHRSRGRSARAHGRGLAARRTAGRPRRHRRRARPGAAARRRPLLDALCLRARAASAHREGGACRCATEAVRLLTVHGAKGLEADTVLLLDADPEKPGNELCSLLIDWPVEARAPLRCAFVYNESQMPAVAAGCCTRGRRRRDEREALNVLYVAMTRARRRLVVQRDRGLRRGQRHDLVAAARAGRARRAAAAGGADDRLSGGAAAPLPPAVLRRLPSWRPADVDRPAQPSSPRDRRRRRGPCRRCSGRAVHRTLEWAAGTAVATALDALAAAAGARVRRRPRARCERHAAAILAHADTRPFFRGPQIRWSGNEVAGQRRRRGAAHRPAGADRGGRREPVWWVLDYKLRHAPEALEPYRQQLLRYRDAVRARAAGPGGALRLHRRRRAGGRDRLAP